MFGFQGLRQPLFAAAPTEPPLTRTYTGRVTLPLDLPDPAALWVLDQQATIVSSGSNDNERWVQYEVVATCTTCDHAHARIGGPDSPIVLTAPSSIEGDPVQVGFDLRSTAWMVLGLATGDGPALAEPVTYQQRPDLNNYVQDLEGLLTDDVGLRGTTGVDEHGGADIDSEALFGVDDLVAEPSVPSPPAPALPWLLPIAQSGIEETLVVWGPQGRSAGLAPVDGRYQLALPTTGGDYAYRRVQPQGQSRAATSTYPPDGFGQLEMRALDGDRLELTSEPDHWVALRDGGEPIVCRTNAQGLVELPRPEQPFEIGVVEPQDLSVVAYRRCEANLACD